VLTSQGSQVQSLPRPPFFFLIKQTLSAPVTHCATVVGWFN
jgi:hypothetical protein